MTSPDAPHEHTYVHLGLVYEHADYPMAGTGARVRTYYHRFFCQGCLDVQDRDPFVHGSSYEKPLELAVPRRTLHDPRQQF